MSTPLLAVSELNVALPKGSSRDFAVEGVAFDIAAGETLCLVGESGSGKSVVAHAILRLLPRALMRTSGKILWNGADLGALDADGMRRVRGRAIGTVFQEPGTALNPLATCGAQMHEAIEVHRPGAATRSLVDRAFLDVGLPDPARIVRSFPFELSGGQRQRVAIAMALANDPLLIIADEPTTALDVTTQARVLELFKAKSGGSDQPALLFITHDLAVVEQIADKVAVMKDGRIVEAGPVSQVLHAPEHPYTRSLCAATFAPPRMGGAGPEQPPMLELRQASKTYMPRTGWFGKPQGTAALAPLDLTVARGECLAVVGESGSGKSTLARIVTGLETLSDGHVLLHPAEGEPVAITSPADCARYVQMVFQDPVNSLNPRMRVMEAVTRGARAQGLDRRSARSRAAELMQAVSLTPDMLTRYPAEFSGGQRQRIAIARALMTRPQVLIADEAISALDVSVQVQVLTLLDSLRHRFDLTLVFITHDLRAAAAIADKVLVMQTGKVVEYGTADKVFGEPAHDYTKALLAASPTRRAV